VSGTDQESYWKERVESWKASGLTRKEYCEKEGVDLTKFLYRLTRYGKRTQGVNFTEVSLGTGKGGLGISGLQVLLPNGIRLSLGGEPSSEFLESLLIQLGRLRCSD
jgi:hypothetical protein